MGSNPVRQFVAESIGSRSTHWPDSAILGVGRSKFEKRTSKSIGELAIDAATAAINDAGLNRDQIDAVVTFTLGDTIPAAGISTILGLPSPRVALTIEGGGNVFVSAMGTSAALVLSGAASRVLCVRALKARSGKRLGGTNEPEYISTKGTRQFTGPYGWSAYAHTFALVAKRFMMRYGIQDDAMAGAMFEVVRAERAFAVRNPRAIMRDNVSREQYSESPMVSDPIRIVDCCLESDGACALIIGRADQASTTPIRILSFVEGGGRWPGDDLLAFLDWDDWSTIYASYVAAELYREAGLSPSDIDFAMLYDNFSSNVLMQLEAFGFCEPGGVVEHMQRDGISELARVPVNPHGGLMAEAYVHGMNGVAEAVDQLRGRAEGVQLARHSACLVASGGVGAGSAMILGI